MAIAIIAVIASLLLPAVGRARERARLTQCKNNFRQLQTAWQMYADDHGDVAVNPAGDFRNITPMVTGQIWVQGYLNYVPDNFDNFNTAYLIEPEYAAFGNYLHNANVYKCPSDHSTSLEHGLQTARDRSYSYNFDWGSVADQINPGAIRIGHLRIPEVRNISSAITFIEQHEDSLGPPYFSLPFYVTGTGTMFADIPSGRHDRTCAVAFSDGHVEGHKWIDPRTIPPVLGKSQPVEPQSAFPNNPDLAWLADRHVKY